MNRIIYDKAFQIISTQKELCDKLDSLGLNFEYGQGFIGKTLEDLINNSETIVLESLGLEYYNPTEKKCNINGSEYPVVVERLYTKDHQHDWSITVDDFSDFFYKAIENHHIQDLMWRIMVEKDEDAKAEYNSLNIGFVGPFEQKYS